MENNWSRPSRNSLTPVKQRRSGYEPSYAETDIPDSPWHGGNKWPSGEWESEGAKPELYLGRTISPLKQSRRSSRFEYEGPTPRTTSVVSPVRRRTSSKSPYKPRRDDSNARTLPMAGSDIHRNISPLGKSERRRHVSPFQTDREERNMNDDGDEIVGSNRNLLHQRRNSRRSAAAPQHRSPRETNQQRNCSITPTKGERTPSPLSKSMAHQKQRQVSTPSVGEINEMLAHAKLARTSPNSMLNNKAALVYESSDSIAAGDIFFSRECDVMALPRNHSQKPKVDSSAASQQRSTTRSNSNFDQNVNIRGLLSLYGLSQTTTTASSSAVSRQSSGKLSMASSKTSDASRTTTASMRKFTDNRRKSEGQAWFSCMKKSSCKNKKLSPEQSAFNEAAFIEKAFVVESLRQLWADKHRPSSLNGFACHKQEAQVLKQLAIDNVSPHILFSGPTGSGKKALTMAYLREIYGDVSWEISHDLRYFRVQEQRPMQVVVPLTSSLHHVELNVQLEPNARYALMGLVKEINNNEIAHEVSSINSKANHRVMVLYGVDKATAHIQHLIKWIMDCHSESWKLILCCENDTGVIESVKNRCMVIKVDAPATHEIMEVLIQIASKEDFDLPMSFASKIANKSKQNLREAIMGLEVCKAHNYPFEDEQPIPLGWEEVLLELASEILADPSPKRLFFIRGKFQKLLIDFVHPKLILLKLVELFLKGVASSSRRELYYWHAYYEKRLPEGASALLKLEEFVAKFMSIHRKSSNHQEYV
ncbi:hypothetical protein C1H46_032784 [Malus baccata]|uniref:Replication factor C C-terminal domain-containing protein n=1 Tax=Malus baccata TaxID=106549 RepID=A0A540L5D4_MALBA|nr:hypothetical protein C1H46_032784 [Malus baccata]